MEIVCHRGANHFAPENTLAAAEICFENKWDYVELDARTTLDGKIVVLHDESVDRTTNASGLIAEMTWDQVSVLDAGSWFGAKYSGERIPLLADLLALAGQMNGQIYIEPKAVDARHLLDVVAGSGMNECVFYGSEDVDFMSHLRLLAPGAMLMARRCDYSSFRDTVEHTAAQIVEFSQGVDELDEVQLCREYSVRSMIYDQSHDRDQLERTMALGPDLINVDRPDIVAELRAKNQSA